MSHRLLLMLLLVLASILHVIIWSKGSDHVLSGDSHDIWLEGHRLFEGINPYARTLSGDMLHNDNYPTYFPLAYLFTAALSHLGLSSYEAVLAVWRPLSLLCHLGLAWMIYQAYALQRSGWAGVVAAALLLFGRWGVYLIMSAQLEFAALLPLVLGIALQHRRPRMSALLVGLSLAIKQIGVLIVPLLLINRCRAAAPAPEATPRRSIPDLVIGLKALTWISLIPLLISLPFLLSSPWGFLESMVFSLTRLPMGHPETGEAPILLFGMHGVRVVMAALIIGAWSLYARGQLRFWSAASFCLLALTQLNDVVFTQYYLWLLVAVLLAISEALPPATPSLARERAHE
ncbi:hypothetical protein BBFGKLBO_00184 [Synechococcus sp. CBW1107]|uniref:glycosyltransferase 87 family protein n=1 Tax=Synechococcus sp. CBW1107 TaxID=2789857 RepID=UPI002AD44D2D|nr:glycosyltransferase 87 family protein [Synechococcus sp. CBW1107]CAK6687291.1 hypothetical protein BBFGKLBO_00184 [Synechococcus sp. CBW1107]